MNKSAFKGLHHVIVALVALVAYLCYPVAGSGKPSSGKELQESHQGYQVRGVNHSKDSQEQRRHGEWVAGTAAQELETERVAT